MTKQILAFLFFLSFAPLLAQVDKQNSEYGFYQNKIFDFEMIYPKELCQANAGTDNVSGNYLVSRDGKTHLSVWAKLNGDSGDWKKEYEQALVVLRGANITYKVFKNKIFVISGFKGDRVIYWKEQAYIQGDRNVCLTFSMEFPKSEKIKWDTILTKCVNSIKFHTRKYILISMNKHSDFFDDKTLENLSDEDWYEVVKPFGYGFHDLRQEEIAALASRFNWDKHKKLIFLKFINKDYKTQNLRPTFGITYEDEEERSRDGKTKEERDEAFKGAADYEKEACAPQKKSFHEEYKYVGELRKVLGSEDAEFFEWFREDGVLLAPKTYGASIEVNYAELLASEQVHAYKKYESLFFKSKEDFGKYFQLWEKEVKDRMALAELNDTRQWGKPFKNSSDELGRLNREMPELAHEMFILDPNKKNERVRR